VRMTHVDIPLPPDPSGPEGALPSVAADVYAPAAPGPFPLVSISHAWPGTLREFPLSVWGNRLASRGFVVIVSDRRAASAVPEQASMFDQPADVADLGTDVNSEDILRVLRWAIAQNTTAGSPLFGQVDPSRLAIAGHSLGAYMATFAAIKAQTEGPALSALVLLDPSDERLGNNTLNSSLTVSPQVHIPTIDLASEENQHPVQCDMADGNDCTLVANQQWAALIGAPAKLGLKVNGSVHEDVEDTGTPGFRQMYLRYAMAWIEYWTSQDCAAAPYLGGPAAAPDQQAGRIGLFAGGSPPPACNP
jgi:dienelactone hydrolase